jgi:hypothetical protein
MFIPVDPVPPPMVIDMVIDGCSGSGSPGEEEEETMRTFHTLSLHFRCLFPFPCNDRT